MCPGSATSPPPAAGEWPSALSGSTCPDDNVVRLPRITPPLRETRMFRAVLLCCGVATLLTPSLPMTSAADKADPPKNREPVKLTDEARAIHREALVFDGHNDLPWQFREKAGLSFTRLD